MIVQNKDDITIPLDLDMIPSAKEFKDAISSLSPEQQRFAKAFRSMQLESTLFGICVIQIKPQLERVLNLPPDSLTKEIKLTQDLMELFITYQIPSDLLSYDGDAVASVREKVDRVRHHVGAIREVINATKEVELQEKKQETMYRSGGFPPQQYSSSSSSFGNRSSLFYPYVLLSTQTPFDSLSRFEMQRRLQHGTSPPVSPVPPVL